MPLLLTPRALAQRGEFYYQLATMIRAGLPLIGAPLFTAVYGAMYAMVFSAGHPTRLGQ